MEITLVLVILGVAVALFATEKLSVDLVALLVLAALLALGLVTPTEGVSGFSNPATLTVAAMFVLSAGLQKTGAVAVLGRALTRVGRGELLMLVAVMVPIGFISAFINNTAAVAIFLPFVINAAGGRKVPASRLLIPLSFASQFGGVCTLIGTSTNLLVNSISQQAGYSGFGMFEFSRLGLIMFGAGVVFFLVVGRRLLPVRHEGQLTENFGLGEYMAELRVLAGSPLIGKRILETRLGSDHDVTVLEIIRNERKIWAPRSEPIQDGDVLLVRSQLKNLMSVKAAVKAELEPQFQLKDEALQSEEARLVEAMVAPRSRLIGKTLSELSFRWRFNALTLAIQRRGHLLREQLANIRLRLGDVMLLLGRKEDLVRLRRNENFVVLNEVEEPSLRRRKAPLALLIIVAVVALAALKLMPIMVSAILGCAVMLLTRCLTLEDAYDAVEWRVILLLAGVLPLGIALQNSGAAQLIAQYTLGTVGQFGPITVLAVLYLLTAVMTECMSNNAAAVLLAPIAISTAVKLGVDPKPFLVAVTFAASTSFATPVGYQTNTMVYGAGGYRFTDFTKVGVPLNLIFWGLAVYFIPRFWPF